MTEWGIRRLVDILLENHLMCVILIQFQLITLIRRGRL